MTKTAMTVAGILAIAAGANAGISITEYMYSGSGGEYIELTNLGTESVDLTGWVFIDSDRLEGAEEESDLFDLSSFGMVAPGESIIITEDDAATFAADWSLDPAVRVLGLLGFDTGKNIGRSDELNIYDADSNLVDRLTYGDEDFAGTIRTKDISGNPLAGAEGQNDIFNWIYSAEGDSFGSYLSANGDLGNPGYFTVPTPGTMALIGLAGLGATRRRR
ncbi:MAG: lamin tail domain-containing protein [Phycisphaerales bacterium JB050]